MSAIFYKNLPYGAGGSNVEANPSGSSTDDLEKIGIDGTVYDVTDADAVHSSDKGVANGVASLDATGRVPSTQLPSYVDDVLEYASQSAFPATGESGKIYIALDTNKTYRWSGSAYVEISESLALGETTGTAYEGSKGKANADNIASLQTAMDKAYKTDDSAETDLQDTDYFPFYDTSATSKKKSLWSNIKAKLKAYFDTLYDKTPTLATVATSGSYNDLTNKPTIPSGQIQSDWNQTDSAQVDFIKNKPSIPTNTDEKVKQENTTGSADYRVLLSNGANDTTETKTARKSTNLKFNPSTGNLQATQLNGVTIGSSPKFTDNNTTYTLSADTDNNQIKLTPSSGSSQSITVPYATASGMCVGQATSAVNDTDGNPIKTTYSKTDEKVKQENTTTNAEYRILFSNGANNTTETKTARKSANLTYNPSTKKMDLTNSGKISAGYVLFPVGSYDVTLTSDSPISANRTLKLPNEDGTIATREYLNSNLGWKKWYNSNITPTSTNTDYTVTAGISSIHEVMVALYYGRVYRQTIIYPAAHADGSLIFPDFYWAGSRLYFQMTKVSDTKIRIGSAGSSGSISWSNCQVTLYYR